MYRILFILTIVSLLAKDIASLSWQTWFYVNQSEIAAEKCENKAKPMMNCDGKCYLSKQLQKLEQKEQNHNNKSNPFQNLEKVHFFVADFIVEFVPNFKNLKEKEEFAYKAIFSTGKSNEIFHPPTV